MVVTKKRRRGAAVEVVGQLHGFVLVVKTLLLRCAVGPEHRSKLESTNTGGGAVDVEVGISSGNEVSGGSSKRVRRMTKGSGAATSPRERRTGQERLVGTANGDPS